MTRDHEGGRAGCHRRALIAAPVRSRGALAATRLLAAAGWCVGVACPQPGLAGRSRACGAWHRSPLPEESPAGFTARIRELIARHGYDLVFGAGDAEVLALSGARQQLGAVVPYGPHSQVLRAIDKHDQVRLAHRVGLAAPATAVATPDVARAWPLPAVVKARLHWQPGRAGPARAFHARVVRDRSALVEAVAAARAISREPVVQALVEGVDLTLALLMDRGRVLARVQQVGGYATPGGGEYTRSQTAAVDEELAAAGGRFLAELGWRGLAQLQFIQPPGGRPSLIDVNPRFYGSIALAARAGVDLPGRWAAVATGETVTGPVDAPAGVRFAYLEGDLRRARVERRGGLAADVLDSALYAARHADRQWYWRDPRPATHLAAAFAGDALRLARRGVGGQRPPTGPHRSEAAPATRGEAVDSEPAGQRRRVSGR